MIRYTYPKDKISKGSRIVLYGYGEIGQFILKRIHFEEYCSVVLIIDNKHKGENVDGINIISVNEITNFCFDKILLCSVEYADEMEKTLLENGIKKDKIIKLSLHNKIVRLRDDIPYMEIDKVQESYAENFGEYVRYRCFELIVEEIKRKKLDGEIAEAGVYMGNFAKALSFAFPNKKLFLYDTFNGFEKSDMDEEIKKGFTSTKRLANRQGITIFQREDMSSEQQIEFIKNKLYKKEGVYFRKGNFPYSADGEKEIKFCCVSLDMDLYRPTKDGLCFFWPRLVKGGYILLHDYNGVEHSGIRKALEEVENLYGEIAKVPIPDEYGTVVLVK